MLTMARLKYLFAMVILLIWVASLLLKYDPRFYGLSLLVDLGCTVTVTVFALSALIWRKWNAFATFSLLLAVLIVGVCASFAYRLNNVCGPGDHIIRSEADAIETAKARILQARYGSHGIPGYVDEKPGFVDFSHADNCCTVTRSRTAIGVIVWEVGLEGDTMGEPKTRHVSAFLPLSNCGVVFRDESRIFAGPKRDPTRSSVN
jgi:hypothetical protein